MKRIVTFILTITCLTATACQKERGYTGFVDPSESSIAQMSISTDKAMYAPGDGNIELFAITEATATFASFTAAPRSISF